MQIVAYCPECQSRYQLNADLVGRRMRCPNSVCRTTFVVREATSGPPREADVGPRAANARGELAVPLRGNEAARRAAPEPVEEIDWREAPPPVQASALPPSAPRPVDDRPVIGAPAVVVKSVPPPPRPALTADHSEPTRRTGWKLLALGVLIAGLLGGGGWVVVSRFARAEDDLRADAEKDYHGGIYRGATQKYQELSRRFGGSPRAGEYRFLAGLSELREALGRTPPEPGEALQRADEFLDQYGRDPLLKERREDLGRSLWAFGSELAAAAEAALNSAEFEAASPDVAHRSKVVGLVRRVPAREARPDELDARFARVEANLVTARARRQHLTDTLAHFDQPKPDERAIHVAIQRHRLANEPAIVAALDKLKRKSEQVVYERLNQRPSVAGPSDGPPSLLLDPQAARLPMSDLGSRTPEIVLAVSRGLLTALDGRDGRSLWTARVGLDAGDLPVRVPAPPRGDEPELVVVASTDPPGLTARDTHTGVVRWHQPVAEPVLGRPVLAGDRLFVATTGPDGAVLDLDARSGLLNGRFVTGRQLAAGAAFDPATARLYVPAFGHYVYVFTYDSAPAPRCEGGLTTGHTPGGLRGEPIIFGGEDVADGVRHLVLGEADGLGSMRLRAFPLLPRSPTAVAPPAEVRLSGWSWFPPYHDAEKLALVTDSGEVGLFGVGQNNTADPALFPLLAVGAAVGSPMPGLQKRPARAQLVHAEEHSFWVLADGTLQHWKRGMDRRAGLRLSPVWGSGVRLGAPLHAGQVSADRSTLFVVTQTDAPPAHWAAAVDARSGQVRWQRPLGLSPRGDPVTLGGAVFVLDTAGALYRFDPARHPADPPGVWQSAGELIAKSLTKLVGEPELLRAADGLSAYAFLCRSGEAGGCELVVRQALADGSVNELTVILPAPPAGTPALTPAAAVVPLMDGTLCRVPLDFDNPQKSQPGPNWRAQGTRTGVRGAVLHWRGDEYLVWNGGRRLLALRWPSASEFRLDTDRALELARPPVGAPVRLPDVDGEPTGAVADASGTLTLFRGAVPRVVRTWKLEGSVTAGPWVVGEKMALVVEHSKLVWLDPAQDAPLWTATLDGDGIAAAPQFMSGRLVVSDLAGRFVALDPATGRPLGVAYRHPAEVAPVAVPMPFGAGRLFAPMTDGTILLLPLAALAETGR